MISVIVPTNRAGGIDILLDSLARQTFRDFELILVDALLPYRSPIVTQAFKTTHIPPRDNRFPSQMFCRQVNTGIAHARGETIVLLCDYSYLSPDCLATHARLQAIAPVPVTCDYCYIGLPELKPGLPHYVQSVEPTDEATNAEYVEQVNANSDRYAADVRSGRLDDYMWSIFAEPMTAEAIKAAPATHKHMPSTTAKLHEDWNWCSLKNESFPTKLFLDMNGIDEAYDRSHVYQDSEFSYRLRERGIRWYSGEPGEGMVTVVNPRPIMNIKRLAEPITYNQKLCFDERDASRRLPVNPGFSLQAWRERVLRG